MCGAVTYTANAPLESILHCHCENCRRTSGNHVAAARTATDQLEIAADGGTLQWYDLGYARYGFCGRCGSTMFYRAADRSHLTSVMVGTIDDTTGLEVAEIWYAAHAQPHQALPAHVPRFDGDP